MHVQLGKYNQLEVVKAVDFGIYLDGGDDGEILLPARYVPAGCKPGDMLDVFIYLDNKERLVATTLAPYVQVGGFACLKVAWTNEFGAFLDWGLMKDLFVPFREQKMKMQKGGSYVVHVHIDKDSNRIMASAKVERFLSKEMPDYRPGEKVEILVWKKTDLGFKAIIENRFVGMIYANEIFQIVNIGDRLEAYVKQVRPDGKIDLKLQWGGTREVDDFSDILLEYIRSHNGYTGFNDKSPAGRIYETFGVSKKTFKKTVGNLYKRHLVVLEENGIRLV